MEGTLRLLKLCTNFTAPLHLAYDIDIKAVPEQCLISSSRRVYVEISTCIPVVKNK